MTILLNNLKRIFGKRINIICMIVVPLILNIVLISVTTQEVKYHVGIVDKDETQFTADFIDLLKEDYTVSFIREDEINSTVINGMVDCLLVFDKGFTNEIINGSEVYARIYALNDTNGSQPVIMYLDSYISAVKEIGLASAGDEQLFYEGMKSFNQNTYRAEYKNVSSSITADVDRAVTSLGYIAVGMVFLMTFATMLILDDKTAGIYDRIATTPVSRYSYLIQHLIAYFVVALIQIVALINLLPNIIDVSYGSTSEDNFLIIVICAAFAITCISIGITISRFSKNTLMAGSLVSLINIPMLMLGGCFWPRELMPETVKNIGNFMPTTWFLKASESILYGNGISSASRYIVYMVMLSTVLIFIAFIVKTDKEK